ncbi:hypothetical protein MBLNU459_g2686t1 [Dothideomycetes sp. NU459]
MSSPQKEYSIAVVGGGIGGLCTAIGLLSKGIPTIIYESAAAFAEIGAGVSFGPNAARAMSMIDPRIEAGFRKCATNNAWPENQNYWFSFRRGQDLTSKVGSPICDLWCSTGQTSVHRARYLDEVIKLVPPEVARFGKRIKDVDDCGDHVVLRFEDGTEATHSAVIGCDGVKSRIRQILLGVDNPAAHPQFTGKYAYRGLIPMDDAARVMGDELARNSQMYLGKDGHILTFPIEKGRTMNVVAFRTKEDGKWDDEQWVKPMQKADMYREFKGWVESTHAIFGLMQKPDVWALFDTASAETYTKGRICILGDAAHASTPHQGAGAGMAIEDALIMSSAMALVDDSKDIPRAFQVFDAMQRPRSQKLVTTSREAGMLYEMQLPGVGEDVEKIKEHLSRRMKWLWDVDLDARVKEAKEMFGSGTGQVAKL